jgi:hypothetical protein
VKRRPGAKAPFLRAFFVGLKPYANPQEQKQIRRSLRCAAHDETVSSFGRDDDSFGRVEEDKQQLG